MRAFTDSAGREWQIDLTVGSMQRLKGLGYDLANIEQPREGKTAPIGHELNVDPFFFAEVLWAIVKPQAGELAEPDFWAALDGRSLNDARQALREELSDFFQSEPFRRAYLEKARVLLEAISEGIGRMPGNSSTSGPASSVSIPAP